MADKYDGSNDDLAYIRVYPTGGFKKSHELTWFIGVVPAVLTSSLGVTGYSLPRDQIDYWAVKIVTGVQMAKKITELANLGKDLLANQIMYLPPVKDVPKNDSVFHKFQLRRDAYGKLWKALVIEGNFVVLGIPGVGKTRMMEQIWKETKEKKIFNKILRADVASERLDVINYKMKIYAI